MNFQKYHVSKNLFNLSAYYAVDSGITNISIDNGAITYNASSQYGAIRYRFNLSVSDVFTVGLGSDSDKIRLELRYLKNNAQVGETIVIQKGNYQIIRGGNEYDAFSIYISNGTYTGICKASNIMLNSGSTTLPYEPYGNTWNSIPYYIRKTATDNITSLPTTIYGDGTSASLTIKGNTVQNGTPSPSNPVTVSGVGERTGNLLMYPYYSADSTIDGVTYITTANGSIKATGTTEKGTNFYLFRETSIAAGTYTISINGVHSGMTLRLRDQGSSVNIVNMNVNDSSATFTLESDVPNATLYFNQSSANKAVNIDCTIMFNTGDEALPYEPYGYKIPISLGNTTISIYTTNPIHKIDGITTPIQRTTSGSDEISSNGTLTRVITKMELDGTEADWRKGGGEGNMAFFVNGSVLNGAAGSPILCSHFPVGNVGSTTTDTGIFIGSTGANLRIRPENVASMELTDWTTWLSNQKAAGTPVTIYYVAATPATEQVTVPSLPTTGTPEQFDVETTLKPSEVQLTYHGWHIADVHEYHVSTNLIDCEIEDGKYGDTTGKKQASDTSLRTSDYVPVEPNTTYCFGIDGRSRAVYIYQYTADKTFTTRLYPKSNESFTTNATTAYVNCSLSKNQYTSEAFQINKGQTILPYEAYYEPYWD